MTEVYGENFLSVGVEREWCRKLKGRRSDVHDGERQGRMSVVAENLVQRNR